MIECELSFACASANEIFSRRATMNAAKISSIFLACTSALWAATPLTSSGGKTNHPVLFVHGFNAHMTTEWGAIPSPLSGTGCNLAETPVTWAVEKDISHRRSPWGSAQYKHGVLVQAFMQDCAGTNHQIYPKITGAKASLGHSGWIGCSSEVWWGSWDACAKPLRDNSTTSWDGDPVNPTFHLTGQGSNFSGFSKSYHLSTDQQKDLLLARDEFVSNNSGGVVFDDSTVAYPTASESLLDKPLAYLPSSTPKQIQDALVLSAPPADNGLYFFNAKRMWGSLVTVSPAHPVPWSQTYAGRPGQAKQLYEKIASVLDAFYAPLGIDWRSTPSAVIDLVGYSQGGLTIRTMVEQLQNNPNTLDAGGHPYRDVLNHVNRVVSADSPNFGSALITNPDRLTNGLNHPQSPEPLQFPVLGREILNLTERNPGVPVLRVHDLDLVSVNFWDDAGLDLTVDGGSYLGPYTQSQGKVNIFGCAENCSWFDCTFNVPAAYTCWETLTFPFNMQPMLDSLSVLTGKLKTSLNTMRAGASPLTWSDAVDALGNPTGSLIRDALTYNFPRNTAGTRLDVVNLHSKSSGALMTALPDKIEAALYEPCIDALNDATEGYNPFVVASVLDIKATCARVADKFSEGLPIRGFAKDFDADWSMRSDFVVEDFSQQGILVGSDFNPQINPQMKVNAFAKPELAHIEIPFLDDSPLLASHNQGCDILSSLGGNCSGTPSPSTSAFSLAPERLDVLEQKAASGRGEAAYKVRLRYTRNAPGALDDLNLTYYFKEEPVNSPGVAVTSGNWTAQVRQVQGALYAVDLTAHHLGLAEGQTSGETELTFTNANGRPWNPSDDWSSALNPTWHATRRIANTPRPGEVVGLVPEVSTDPTLVTVPIAARAFSKERSSDALQSQPDFSIENTSSATLHGFKVWYLVRSTPSIQLRQYWRTGQAQSTIALKELGQGYFAIEAAYPDWVLQPGERIDEITFEINHADWSVWNFQDDPSYRAENPQSLAVNNKIMVFDMNGNRIGGEDLSYLWETVTTAATAHVEAKNSSTYPDYKVLDFRVRNAGELPIYGVEVRYKLQTEDGRIPQVQFVNTQGCETKLLDEGVGRYEAVMKCPTASLEVGQAWPNGAGDAGLRLEIQYGGGVPVDLDNDPSYAGMSTAWGMASGVVLLDADGDRIFGGASWKPVEATTTWLPNTAYAVGSQVLYQGVNYHCLQAHTSQVGWEPPVVPALWGR
jgi:hypothetical protein